jgi:hypothetical protein
MLEYTSIGISILTLLAVIYFWRDTKTKSEEFDFTSESNPFPKESHLHEIQSENVFSKLSFNDSLDPQKFIEASEECAKNQISKSLENYYGDGVSIAVNSLRLKGSSTEMLVTASKNGKELLKSGKVVFAKTKSGKLLPKLRNVKTGRFTETLKTKGVFGKAGKAANLAAIVVSVAHIISGADTVKRLKEIDTKLNKLIAFHEFDKLATLERIYSQASELLLSPLNAKKKEILWACRGELRELRNAWRRQAEYLLSQTYDPSQKGGLEKFWEGFKGFFGAKNKDGEKVHADISKATPQLSLIEYTLRMEYSLAVVSDTLLQFQFSLEKEMQDFENLSSLLDEKQELIRSSDKKLEIEYVQMGLREMIDNYTNISTQQLCPTSEPEASLENS